MSAGPLDGVKVIDLSVMISGPLATMLLADQGADVIKVESPGLGDLMRYLGSSRGGMTGLFAGCNRGKRGITIDLKHPEGVELLQVDGGDRRRVRAELPARSVCPARHRTRRPAGSEPRPRLRVDLGLRADRPVLEPARLRQRHPGLLGHGRRADRSRHGYADRASQPRLRQGDGVHRGPSDHRGALRPRAGRRRTAHRAGDARRRDRVPVARCRHGSHPARGRRDAQPHDRERVLDHSPRRRIHDGDGAVGLRVPWLVRGDRTARGRRRPAICEPPAQDGEPRRPRTDHDRGRRPHDGRRLPARSYRARRARGTHPGPRRPSR